MRDEKVISLTEAVRRLSGLPATNLGLDHRGFLQPGMFADVVVFDPETIADKATFPNPHQYSIGVRDVFVNGQQVLKNGERRQQDRDERCGGRAKSRAIETRTSDTLLVNVNGN